MSQRYVNESGPVAFRFFSDCHHDKELIYQSPVTNRIATLVSLNSDQQYNHLFFSQKGNWRANVLSSVIDLLANHSIFSVLWPCMQLEWWDNDIGFVSPNIWIVNWKCSCIKRLRENSAVLLVFVYMYTIQGSNFLLFFFSFRRMIWRIVLHFFILLDT